MESAMSLPPELASDLGRAKYFRYHVIQGGFAQLLFNLNGDHLQEIAETLERVGAVHAAGYFERALLACLDDQPNYQAFLSGDFMSDNPVKFTLQLLSVEYFHAGPEFDQEAATWLAGAGRSAPT